MGRSRERWFAIAVSVLSFAACGPKADQKPPAPPGLSAEAERYVDIVLALGARDHDSLDTYSGPPERQAQADRLSLTFPAIRQAATDLRDRLKMATSIPDDDQARRQFLISQLEAIIARIDLLTGKTFTFDEESRTFFGVTVDDVERTSAERVRAELEKLLPGSGRLGARYAAFDRKFMVPRDKVPDVLGRALEECRNVTRQHLSLPEGEGVSIEYTRMMPWSAFTHYEGQGHSRIQINSDFGLTVDRAFNLACHEAYPGHHTINTLIDTRLIGPMHRVELEIQPLFSPQSLRTEGAATFAPEVAFSDADRLAFERDVLFPLAGLNGAEAERYLHVSRLVAQLGWIQADVARRYVDGTLEFARAAAVLEDDALMTSADATLKFFNEFRSYAVTYTVGRDLVARAVSANGAADAARRWRNYEDWITTLR